jgi:FkbM family methyltransferase
MILVLAAFAIWHWRKPLTLLTLASVGRGGMCSAAQVARVPSHWRLGGDATARVVSLSRLAREDGAYEQWDTPHGSFWVPRGSKYLAFNIAEQDRQFYGYGAHGVRKGDIVLDCGASVGVFTRRALAQGAESVVAIEPAPENLECLRRNLSAEIAAGSVTIVPKGVWSTEGVLSFFVDKENSAGDHFVDSPKPDEKPGILRLPVTTIDRLVQELGLQRVDFIKMDIEGSEQQALTGAAVTLNRHRPRLSISTYHREDDAANIPALVLKSAPGYAVDCGPCVVEKLRLRPHALYFRPKS